MKIQPLKIGTKTAKVPVIQGGMGVGISLGNLAGAVAKEGGIGIDQKKSGECDTDQSESDRDTDGEL